MEGAGCRVPQPRNPSLWVIWARLQALAEEPERARESLARAESVPSGIPSMMLAQGCVEPKTLRTGVSVLTLAALDLLAKRTSAR